MSNPVSTCPTLLDVLNTQDCLENGVGLGCDVYVGLKEDLAQPMTLTDNVYSTPVFKSGKGLYKLQCKDDAQQIQGSSLGRKKMFELTCNFTLDSVNRLTSKLSRALNNLDIFIIALDGDDSQIMYDRQRKVVFENGGITSDTGANPSNDERQTVCAAKLRPVKYINLYVETPAEGWDSLLQSVQASA